MLADTFFGPVGLGGGGGAAPTTPPTTPPGTPPSCPPTWPLGSALSVALSAAGSGFGCSLGVSLGMTSSCGFGPSGRVFGRDSDDALRAAGGGGGGGGGTAAVKVTCSEGIGISSTCQTECTSAADNAAPCTASETNSVTRRQRVGFACC